MNSKDLWEKLRGFHTTDNGQAILTLINSELETVRDALEVCDEKEFMRLQGEARTLRKLRENLIRVDDVLRLLEQVDTQS